MAYLQDQIRDINAFHLDRKVVWIWSLNSIFISIILLIFIFILSFTFKDILILDTPISELPFWAFVALLIMNVLYVLWLHWEYTHYLYYFTTSSIVIKKGIFTTERHVIPYGRIQDMRISRSIPERLLNLASVKIETAAPGSQISQYTIPSVSHYRSIVNYIMEKQRSFTGKGGKEKSDNERIISLLKSLVEEVKGLKNVMSKGNTTPKAENEGK